MNMKHFTFNSMALVILALLTLVYGHSFVANALQDETCQPQPLETMELRDEAGELVYVDVDHHALSTDENFASDQTIGAGWRISPNGLYLVGSYVEDIQSGIAYVVLLNRSGERIYSGAPSQATIFDVRWLGNEQVVSFVTFREARTSSLQSIPGFGYFLINPFERAYTYFQQQFEPPFYTYDWFFVGGYDLTFDGRYLFNRGRGVFDFETQQPLNLQNFEWGIPSYTSHKLLVVEYSNANYIDPIEEDTHPVSVYNFGDDTLTQITAFAAERPVNIYSFPNSWSPDETLWAYVLDYNDEIAFRRVELLDLNSGEVRSTCFGLFFETDVAPFSGTSFATSTNPADFAWSRDSRYLALSGVLEGHDMEESFGIYIYDTQTEEIYEVYRGHADIIGWMSNSD